MDGDPNKKKRANGLGGLFIDSSTWSCVVTAKEHQDTRNDGGLLPLLASSKYINPMAQSQQSNIFRFTTDRGLTGVTRMESRSP